MILLECTPGNRPADAINVAQVRDRNHPNAYSLLVMTAPQNGTEYAGDFDGYEACFGAGNELGDYTGELGQEVYTPPTLAGVKAKFNAAQDQLRMTEYRKRTDHLAAESHRKSIDPNASAEEAQAAAEAFIVEVNRIKAEHPKFA